jgi:hypothetical protein
MLTVTYPTQEAVMRRFFGPSPPPVVEAQRNMSLLMMSSNYIFNYPIPLMPAIVSIHSLHVKNKTDPLPEVRNKHCEVRFLPLHLMAPSFL